jgi:hypothetical protein
MMGALRKDYRRGIGARQWDLPKAGNEALKRLGLTRDIASAASGKVVAVQLVGREHEKRAVGPCKCGWSGIKTREFELGKQSQ